MPNTPAMDLYNQAEDELRKLKAAGEADDSEAAKKHAGNLRSILDQLDRMGYVKAKSSGSPARTELDFARPVAPAMSPRQPAPGVPGKRQGS